MICLSLLNGTISTTSADVSAAEVVQSLNVLVAQVESGAFAPVEHPNYALLSHAGKTIKNVLGRVISGVPTSTEVASNVVPPTSQASHDDWMPWVNQDAWDFEIDFWRNLAEHPTLAGMDPSLVGIL